MTQEIKYTDEIDLSWAAAAVDKFQVAAVPDPADPVMLELDGACPRCGHGMQHNEPLIAFRGVAPTNAGALQATVKTLRATGLMTEPLLPAEFSVRCCCQVKHPDPLGRTNLSGCGAAWKMRFEAFGDGK